MLLPIIPVYDCWQYFPGDGEIFQPRQKWKSIVVQYSENTTFHGIKQIFEEETTAIRRWIYEYLKSNTWSKHLKILKNIIFNVIHRLTWLIVVVIAILSFSYGISIKLVYYYSYPSQIDLTVTYLDSVDFPAVYICNPNPFRWEEQCN